MSSSSTTRTPETGRVRRWACVGLAGFLAALAFLPWGAVPESAPPGAMREYVTAVRGWVVWLIVLVPVALLAQRFWGQRIDAALERIRLRIQRLPPARLRLGVSVAMFAAAAVLSAALFRHYPHLVDTVAQLFHARIFAAGSLTAPAPAEGEFFLASHLVQNSGRWFSQYPAGHPALLALGVLVGLPWLVNPLLAGGTVALLFAAARRLFGQGIASLSSGLYLISPFALFMSASYMNHVSVGFFLVLALYAAIRVVQQSGSGWAVAAGLALAAAACIRPLEALAWALILGLWLLRRRGLGSAVIAALAASAGVTPLLAYNWATTGHPLRFGYTLLWGPGHGLGFHTDPWGVPFTPAVSFANTALDFQRLNVASFDWPIPSLLFLLIAVAMAWRFRGAGVLVALFIAAPLVYFFYWHRDNYLGPRFLFASLIPAVLLTALGIAWVDGSAGRWRPALRVALVTAVVVGLTLNVPGRAGVVAGLEQEMKLDPDSEARAQGVEEALVLVKVAWGSRLIGRLWGWGIGASDVESAYRRVDGCRLQLALDESDARIEAGVDSARVRSWLEERLAEWKVKDLPVTDGILPDGSVRVDTTRALARACSDEVARDGSGFTVYESLVWRNDPWLRDGIVYARSLGPARDLTLRRRYPDRPHFLYAPASSRRHDPPVLRPLGGLDDATGTSALPGGGR